MQASPQPSTPSRKTVMVSSTARDLPEHRKEVLDACLRQGMFPLMMEHLPANDAEAIATSLRMVDQADIYLGIFAYRYGYIPKGDLKGARELLDDVWEPAERGPHKLFHADALNVLTQIERDAGDYLAAVKAATMAYHLAWCDGPPFAYHWGLQKAKAHLSALGVTEPIMPPFDESKYEPMPEVEINPPDKRKSKKP